jgi:hypothetical protein
MNNGKEMQDSFDVRFGLCSLAGIGSSWCVNEHLFQRLTSNYNNLGSGSEGALPCQAAGKR